MLIAPLTEAGFKPFGDVLRIPDAGRLVFDGALGSLRPAARPVLAFSRRNPATLPLRVTRMERHRFSSQSFIPLGPARFVVLVAPGRAGRPDMAGAVAFLAAPGQGVTYRPGTWHHPLLVLDAPAAVATLLWQDGSAGDEEFVDVPPFELEGTG